MLSFHPLKTENIFEKIIYVYKYFTYFAEIDYTSICIRIYLSGAARHG